MYNGNLHNIIKSQGILYNEENSMLETAFKSSVDRAKAKMALYGVQLDVVSQIVPLYDSFETQHLGNCNFLH